MQPDPALVAETREWFEKAHEDLAVAGIILNTTPQYSSSAAFHIQQAVEKALKGFLAWYDEPFRKTHDLDEVGRQCIALDATLEPFVQQAIVLSDYAWKLRYPGGPDAPTLADAQRYLGLARAVYEAVLDRLPPEVRPEGAG